MLSFFIVECVVVFVLVVIVVVSVVIVNIQVHPRNLPLKVWSKSGW